MSETFAEMRRVLLTAIEHAERELEQQTKQTQLHSAAHTRRLLTESRTCALELDAELRELVEHLEHVRANVEEIRERLTTCLRQLDEPGDEPPEPEEEAPPPVPTGEDTVRLLRAALETLSRNGNGNGKRESA
jgi:septal ring factor EnvC (AmiA/AmiB activator)